MLSRFARRRAAPPAMRTEADVVARLATPFDQAQAQREAADPFAAAYYGQTDRHAHKWHQYFAVYDRYLSRYRGTPVRLLELGVHNGGSLQVWRRYLGPAAIIHGVDVEPLCAAIDDPDLTVHIGSQDDPDLLRRVVAAMGGVDVVVDDGSHMWRHQIASFEILFPWLDPDGVYICEDVHTSYWPGFGEGRPDAPSFVDHARGLVDRLHAWYRLDDGAADTTFALATKSVSFHDSMVVIEKERREPPRNASVGHRRVV